MGTRTEGAARRVPLLFALLTAAMTASALLYGLLMDEVELYRNILIPFSYVSLGMLIKYGDQAFDDGIFSKKVSLFLAIPGGLWMGSLILIDLGSATIFTGLLFALLMAAKYDNLAFKLGFVVAVGLALFAFVFQTSSLNLLGASSIFLVAFLDEKVNETNSTQRKLIENIDRYSERLHSHVMDLLDMAQLETGRLGLDLQKTDLGKLVLETAREMKVVTSLKKQQLDTALPDNLPKVMVDRRRLHQVLSNLLSNASKYTPENGRIAVEVSLEDMAVTISV